MKEQERLEKVLKDAQALIQDDSYPPKRLRQMIRECDEFLGRTKNERVIDQLINCKKSLLKKLDTL